MTRRRMFAALAALAIGLTPGAAKAVEYDAEPSIGMPENPPREGQQLQANTGNPHADPLNPLESDPTVTMVWLRCNVGGGSCVSTGDTDSFYTLVAADVGNTIRLEVTAQSNFETDTRQSPAAGPIRTDPSNDVPPVISGTARDGETLTSSATIWSGTQPITLTYQWFRCDQGGGNCVAVSGATANSYVLTPADVGSTMRIEVTASNSGPSSPQRVLSNPSAVVQAAPPQVVERPSITGTPRQGRVLELSPGTWSGTPPLSFGYRWQRCTGQTVASCDNIPGAIEPTYRLTVNDVANRVRVLVIADNSAPGSATAASPLSDVIDPPESSAVARLLSPFPKITIGGIARRRGSDVSLLRVQGPRGALVTVRCRGRSCPFARMRRKIRATRVVRIRGLERRLRSGTEIELLVTRTGTIGKYTRLRIRRGKRPKRRDACVRPGATGPSPCP